MIVPTMRGGYVMLNNGDNEVVIGTKTDGLAYGYNLMGDDAPGDFVESAVAALLVVLGTEALDYDEDSYEGVPVVVFTAGDGGEGLSPEELEPDMAPFRGGSVIVRETIGREIVAWLEAGRDCADYLQLVDQLTEGR